MTYAEYKLQYDTQMVWTWISVPIYLVMVIWCASLGEISYDIDSDHWIKLVPYVSIFFIPVFSGVFIYSGTVAWNGLPVGKFIFIPLALGIIGAALGQWIGSLISGEPFIDSGTNASGVWCAVIFAWIGYTYCAISEVIKMANLRGFLVDGDDNPWVKAIKEYENE